LNGRDRLLDYRVIVTYIVPKQLLIRFHFS